MLKFETKTPFKFHCASYQNFCFAIRLYPRKLKALAQRKRERERERENSSAKVLRVSLTKISRVRSTSWKKEPVG